LFTTSGRRLEDIGQRDFVDVVYSYAINSNELRHEFRKALLGYVFDYVVTAPAEEDKTFEGFTKQSMSMLDELDAFQLG
jgi:hypothetical protein